LAEELRAHGWVGIGHSFNHVITRRTRFHRGFATFEGYHAKAGSYGDIADMIQRAKLWLDDGTRPFFLYLQPMNVHGPYTVSGRAAKALLKRRPSTLFKFHGGLATAILDGKLDLRAEFSPKHLESLNDQYDTAIRYTADQLGALFKHLEKHGLYDDALIVVTSDHGEELFDHGGFSHGHTLFEEVVRIPLYVKLPGQRKARVVDDWVALQDVYPTILDVLGIEPPAGLDGRSFLDRMRGEGDRREEKMLFVSTLKKGLVGRALSWQGFKLVQIDKNYEGVEGEVRLYDLAKDPGERDDVAARHPKIVQAHAAEIERLLAEYGKGKGTSKTELSGSEMKQLKALGYAQ
jgi:arylsulfatase A-like enzyme